MIPEPHQAMGAITAPPPVRDRFPGGATACGPEGSSRDPAASAGGRHRTRTRISVIVLIAAALCVSNCGRAVRATGSAVSAVGSGIASAGSAAVGAVSTVGSAAVGTAGTVGSAAVGTAGTVGSAAASTAGAAASGVGSLAGSAGSTGAAAAGVSSASSLTGTSTLASAGAVGMAGLGAAIYTDGFSGTVAEGVRSCITARQNRADASEALTAGGWAPVEGGASVQLLSLNGVTGAVLRDGTCVFRARTANTQGAIFGALDATLNQNWPGQVSPGSPQGRTGACDGHTVRAGRMVAWVQLTAGDGDVCTSGEGAGVTVKFM